MKHLLGGNDEVNNLAPFKYEWAWDMYNKSRRNFWGPEEVAMGQDRTCFEHQLSADEQALFTNVFATLTTSDMVVQRNVAMSIYQHITAPEVRQYLAAQIYEEALHSATYQHVIEILGLDQQEVYTRYLRIPEIAAKFEYADMWSNLLWNFENTEPFILGLMFYYGMFEGVWFYGGFSPIFSLQRRRLMVGSGEQLQYIGRDESMHVAFGIRLIRELIKETGIRPSQERAHQMVLRAVELEADYAAAAMPSVLGYNAFNHERQAKFLANRRLNQLGYDPLFEDAQNPHQWLDEQFTLKKEKNFFETRVTEYQSSGGLSWD